MRRHFELAISVRFAHDTGSNFKLVNPETIFLKAARALQWGFLRFNPKIELERVAS